ncbi:MAG: sulfite exporter TauE/SafE family protein [Kiritimatiellia bacterium]
MMTLASIGSALALGLAGSLHCLGMCGPLALALPANREATKAQRALGRLLYNLGRAVTYAGMGIFAGLFGRVLQVAGFQQALSIVLGVLLMATVFLNTRHMPEWVLNRFYRPVQRGLGRILKRGSYAGLFQTGLLNGLLPCGLVYAALAAASLQAGPVQGSLYMFLFGLGTLPLMFALSLGGLRLHSPQFQPVLNRLIPVVTFTVAVLLILRGLSLGIPYISPVLSSGSCCSH